jgi:hypothetical protein
VFTWVVAPTLEQHRRHRVHQPTAVVYVLLPIPAVLHIPVDMVQLYTGKLIQYDVSFDTYTFCLFVAPVTLAEL